MAKPENQFIAKIHRLMPTVYAEKNNNPYRSGTPDVFYSGNIGDLWVEYKYLTKTPTRSKEIVPDLSAHQQVWLDCRHDEGRNVAVVLGSPKGSVIYQNKSWYMPITSAEFADRMVDNKTLADWIYRQVGDQACPSQELLQELLK